MKDLVYLHPHDIKFKTNDHHIVGYQVGIQAWMPQWTVVNNYDPVICEKEPEAIAKVVNSWMDTLTRQVDMHFGHYLPRENRRDSIRKDFEIHYWQVDVVLGKPFDYQLGSYKQLIGSEA